MKCLLMRTPLALIRPLQYQKALRLKAARQLLANNTNLKRTAYAVGYESKSQFSREYSRLFGHFPKQDSQELQNNLYEVTCAAI